MKRSTVRDKIKLAQNFLSKLRFLADEVRAVVLLFPQHLEMVLDACGIEVIPCFVFFCSLNTAFLMFSSG